MVEIIEEIKRSSYILNLKEDWDDDGAVPIKRSIYNGSLEFLINYASLLQKKGIIIKSPEINPCPNGSIDLSWRVLNTRMLINIKETTDGIIANYYGDINKGDNQIRGNTQIGSIDNHLLTWMESLKIDNK